MKLSTRGRYGTRLMVDLSVHFGSGPVLLRDISERQNISEKYLWQLINPLKNAGLVKSTRGAHGGYELAKDPEKVTLREVVCILEGPMCLVDCVDDVNVCDMSNICCSRDVWKEVTDKILETLDSITLKDMVDKHKSKGALLSYSI